MAPAMAASVSKNEGYMKVDFQRGMLSYALKRHNPPENRHSMVLSHGEVKEMVFQSARLQRVMEEVRG